LRAGGLQDFSAVAEKTGTYTAFDYADIVEYLNGRWRIGERRDLTGEVSC
jgi:acyl-[acyl-carrier-protein] desaturase